MCMCVCETDHVGDGGMRRRGDGRAAKDER